MKDDRIHELEQQLAELSHSGRAIPAEVASTIHEMQAPAATTPPPSTPCTPPTTLPTTDESPSLSDMLSKVPLLRALCICGWHNQDATMRVLRLVNKDLSITASHSVTWCVVHLGRGACPEPRQLSTLLQHANLEILIVHILTDSGCAGQQLATCKSQMSDLWHSMGPAVRKVKTLSIFANHSSKSCGDPDSSLINSGDPALYPAANRTTITHTVCTMLAAALPALTSLHVRGSCIDAAFDAFGDCCPHLTHVQFEALSVPVEALLDIHQHIPTLTSFALTPPDAPNGNLDLSDYVGKCLAMLAPLSSLTKIELKLDGLFDVQCMPEFWSKVPEGVRELVSWCGLHNIQDAPTLLGQLRLLRLTNNSRFDLLQVLQKTPHLQRLVIQGSWQEHSVMTLRCDESHMMLTVCLLRERVMSGLHVECSRLKLTGSGKSIQAVLAMLPTLPSVLSLTLDVNPVDREDIELGLLDHVRRVCPNMTKFLPSQIVRAFFHML